MELSAILNFLNTYQGPIPSQPRGEMLRWTEELVELVGFLVRGERFWWRTVVVRQITQFARRFGIYHYPPMGREVGYVLGPMLDPRIIRDLWSSEPKLAIELLRFARELGGPMWRDLRHPHWEEVIREALHPGQLAALLASDPKAAIELLRFAREVGGRMWREGAHPLLEEIIEEALHPRQLARLLGSDPKAAIELLRFAREAGGPMWRERVGQILFDEETVPWWWMRQLIEEAEASAELLRLAGEFGGPRLRKRLGPRAATVRS